MVAIDVSDDAEKLWLYYPSAVENTDAYLRPSVLIEFGGRNATLPQDTMTIVPDVTAHVPGLALPSAQVEVLSPMRTFWEKATFIHVECHRPDLRASAERLSRHCYQAMLDAQMFYGETLAFDRIIERLTALEWEINRRG